MRLCLRLALGLLAAHPAAAQSPASPAPPSPWGWGVRLGAGAGSGGYAGTASRAYTTSQQELLAGLQLSRYFAGPRASLSLEVLGSSQTVKVTYSQKAAYQPQALSQGYVFVPLCLRSGRPGSRLHLLAGSGPTFRLGQPNPDAAYRAHAAQLTLLVGAEVRLLPFHRYETTLGLRVHAPLTPSYAYGSPASYTAQGVQVDYLAWQEVYSSWVGATLCTTLYPAAK